MSAREWLVACAVVFCATASGCLGCNTSDLGQECRLQKANPDGGRPVDMTGADITADGQDIISLGAQGCEDFICVRDLGKPKPAASDVLIGYCTHACTGSGQGPCAPSKDDEPIRPFQCRPLLLDDQTLRALCVSNPTLCDQYFGPERSSNFCARGASTDAGS
jgi:hypothetical protein